MQSSVRSLRHRSTKWGDHLCSLNFGKEAGSGDVSWERANSYSAKPNLEDSKDETARRLIQSVHHKSLLRARDRHMYSGRETEEGWMERTALRWRLIQAGHGLLLPCSAPESTVKYMNWNCFVSDTVRWTSLYTGSCTHYQYSFARDDNVPCFNLLLPKSASSQRYVVFICLQMRVIQVRMQLFFILWLYPRDLMYELKYRVATLKKTFCSVG